MKATIAENPAAATKRLGEQTVYSILLTISFSHLLNDTIQSLIPSIYPIVKDSFQLSFTQIGLITLAFQLAASLFQPFVGLYTDRKPQPFSLAIGMGVTLTGLIFLAFATNFVMILVSVCFIGMGSSIFHPEASKVAYMAAGARRGLAQSIFQVGGNTGSALGPLLAALIIAPHKPLSILWFCLLALIAIVVLGSIGKWYRQNMQKIIRKNTVLQTDNFLPRRKIIISVIILLVLIFSKYFYLASMTSYYTFYLIEKFHISVQSSQLYLFIFLFSTAVGTIMGGPLGDKFGRKYIIWFSILGVAPFSLLLPHLDLFWTSISSVFIGLILSSAFPAILVYAQELIPGKIGMISGLFFGFAFGMGGLGSALLGALADKTSIEHVYNICAFLPLIGIITFFLPNIGRHKKKVSK